MIDAYFQYDKLVNGDELSMQHTTLLNKFIYNELIYFNVTLKVQTGVQYNREYDALVLKVNVNKIISC